MAIKIFTDSSCDLPKELIESNDIHVIPLHVSFRDQTFLDRVNLSVDEFYQKMREESELPKTAAPSPNDFLQLFKKAMGPEDEGLVLSLSSQLSSTYQSAKLAVEMYKEEYSNAKIEAFDSKNGSIGVGVILVHIVKMIEKGMTYEEIIQKIQDIIDKTYTLVLLETLENAVKGGRVDWVKGKIASVLSIKVLLEVSYKGSVEVLEKVRGSKNAMKRLLELVEEYGDNLDESVFGIAHSNCEEKAKQVKEMLEKKYKAAKIILTEIGPTIGTYSGEGGILISF